MKYMMLLAPEDWSAFESRPKAEAEKTFARIAQWWDDHARKGLIVEGHQLQGPETATTVRRRNGKPTVTDGPFIEAKEAVGGYGILEVPDLDAALAIAKSWPGEGTVIELRPVKERDR